MVCGGLSIYCFATPTLHYPYIQTSSVVGLLLSLYTLYKTVTNKHKFDLISKLWNMTTMVLYEHPSLFALSLLLSLIHVLFSVLWLWMFGHLLYSDLQWETQTWIAFYILIYFWTSALLKNLEKSVVASIVGQWYFELEHEDEEWDMVPRQNTFYHFRYVGSRSFGTIAFASLILGGIHSIHFMAKRIHSTKNPLLRNRFIKFVMNSIVSFCEHYTGYVMTFAGISGQSLSQSALGVTRLFRRHLIFGLSTSFLAKLLSFVGKTVVASSTGLIVYSTYGFRQDMGYHYMFFICTVIPYYILNICTHVWESTYSFIDIDWMPASFAL
jgi:hypothetical protein